MRVISQDGKIDVPYKIATILKRGNTILARNDRAEFELAEYSTEAKAIKAMEMLREEYLKYMEIEGHADLTGQGIIQPNFWVLPKVFQFPQDDEIEV